MTRDELFGTGQVLLACCIWGIAPILYKLFAHLDLHSLLIYRSAFTFACAFVVVFVKGQYRSLQAIVNSLPSLSFTLCTSTIMAIDWFLYIWSVLNDRIVEATIGCFLSPIACILIGRFLLAETINKHKAAAIILSVMGVFCLIGGINQFPWITALVTITSSLLATLRKLNPSDCLAGVTVESFFLLLFFSTISYLAGTDFTFISILDGDSRIIWLTGLATFFPAYYYSQGAKKVKISSLGMISLLRPIIRFLVVVLILGETVSQNQTFAMLFIFGSFCCYFLEYSGSYTHQKYHQNPSSA